MHLEEYFIANDAGDISRKIWYGETICHNSGAVTQSVPRQICIFLDGEFYVERLSANEILQTMCDNGKLPALACLFVSHVDGATRHVDFTCDVDYADYIANDLLNWILKRTGSSKTSALSAHALPQYLLAGISLSGLQAAFTSLHYPHLFARTLCHSGSFWWEDEWLASQLPSLRQKSTALSSGNRFWISVGDKETQTEVRHPPTDLHQKVTQIEACQRFADSLQKHGSAIRYHLYEGGHDMEPWKNELPHAMQWMLDETCPAS